MSHYYYDYFFLNNNRPCTAAKVSIIGEGEEGSWEDITLIFSLIFKLILLLKNTAVDEVLSEKKLQSACMIDNTVGESSYAYLGQVFKCLLPTVYC